TLHFGLGKANEVDSVQIRWPSGMVQTIGKTRANQTLKISENGSGKT
ncbi:MAG: ASPIC/UnbV domain-containing protein, partial [Acidobacteriaceae bacterium]|nr:ASPIC/UnbV domain-containing protein [Acidobacteriaceae bacterium]